MSIDGPSLQISVQQQERWRRRMSVTVPADQVRQERRHVTSRLVKRLKLPGFRKGKIPDSVVESRFGDALRQETLDRVIGEAYRQALAAEDLHPISEGEIEDLVYEPGEDLTFAITFDVQPEIHVGRLGGFAVERPVQQVEDAHIDQVLERLRRQHGSWKPAEGGSPEDGHLAAVTIRKLQDGESAPEPREYELVLGQGDAIPDIERAIKSLAVGESGRFVVTFPDDFSDEGRRGEEEEVEIHLVGTRELELPPLDDDFARKMGDFGSLTDMRGKVLEDLKTDAHAQAESVVWARLLDFLMEANPFEVPESMVTKYAESVIGEQSDLPEDKLQGLIETIRPQAETAVKRILLVDRVADTQELRTTEEEMDQRVEEIAARNGMTPSQVYTDLRNSGRVESLEREIMERKVFDFLKAESEITDAPPGT